MSKIASAAYDRPRKADDNSDGSDVCLDNDLGAEWTGNMDCDDGAKKNDDSDKRKDRRRKTTTVIKGKIGAEPESGGLSGYTATLVALRLEHRSAGASTSTSVAGIVLVLPESMSWSHPNR
jgi:hypothetical protein